MSDPIFWLWEAIDRQFGAELQAGKHAEYPELKRFWLEGLFEEAEAHAVKSGNFSEFTN